MLVGGALGPLNASSQAIDQLVGRYRPWDLVQLLSQLRVPFGENCVYPRKPRDQVRVSSVTQAHHLMRTQWGGGRAGSRREGM